MENRRHESNPEKLVASKFFLGKVKFGQVKLGYWLD
jgi:hypothetical protein